jgi:N6-adenosine-specific RNA methylase IME4
MVGKPQGKRKVALTKAEIQQRWRAKKKRLAPGAKKRASREARLDIMRSATVREMTRLDNMPPIYNVLYIDPPPKFESYSDITGMDRAADNHYQTMDREELWRLVPKIAKLAAPVCRMYLWATVPLMPLMVEFMTACGFTYSSHIVWVKTTLDGTKLKLGTGYETRNAHELLLIGDNSPLVPSPLPGEQPPSVVFAPRTEHSVKPVIFYEIIERLFPDMRKLEMFARGEAREGWDTWGNESDAAE